MYTVYTILYICIHTPRKCRSIGAARSAALLWRDCDHIIENSYQQGNLPTRYASFRMDKEVAL